MKVKCLGGEGISTTEIVKLSGGRINIQLPGVKDAQSATNAIGTQATVLTPPNGLLDLGHLDGWGAGKYGGTTIFMPWTRGNAHERFATLVVQGTGTLQVKVGSCRMGWLNLELSV